MGSGGNSGQVSHQQYLTSWHSEFMYNAVSGPAAVLMDTNIMDITDLTTTAGGGNPYTGVVSYDPDTDITDAFVRINNFADVVDAMGTTIADDVNTFEKRQRLLLARSTNRVAGMFRDINGALSTAYPSALALLEDGYNQDVAAYTAKAEIAKVASMEAQANLHLQAEMAKIQILDKQIEGDTELNREESLWDLNTYLLGVSALGAIAGVAQASTTKAVSRGPLGTLFSLFK